MIVSQLMGGLGNQMFQYAFGLSLSNKYNVQFSIDLSYLKRRDFGPLFVYRDYDLDIFDINESFDFPTIDIEISEKTFEYSKTLLDSIERNLEKNILLTGQFQTPKYFDENLIKDKFIFKEKIEDADIYTIHLLNKIRSCNSVMLNVRRTDYLNTDFHGVMNLDYFNNSISIIKEKVKNPHFFIFSDDIDWCSDNFVLDDMTIVGHQFKGNKFSYYLQLMINCNHFIIPNSTFAWWSAFLSKNSNKVVICPKNWFNNNINTSDLIPDNWIRI